MTVEFDESFYTSLVKLKNPDVHPKILQIITMLENADSLRDIGSVKKLKGYSSYYRIRKGDYRIGIEQIEVDTIRLILVAHRKDIYSRFP
jgi:mRNA interferase RelE/StbE